MMKNVHEELMVTIRCLAYNHEKYIRKCLDGFIMQKTNFRFEAIVHDDASTDKTAIIIKEYAEKFPNIIRPIFETENQYSKHDGSLRRIMDAHMHGKYIALCEGDDYWTDPNKLQKQVDYLESHSDYSMCFHNAIQHYEGDVMNYFSGKVKQDCVFKQIEDREYSGVDIYKEWTIPTASVVFRSSVLTSDKYLTCSNNSNFIFGDIVLFLSCSEQGKLRGMSDIMSVYRRHAQGVTVSATKNLLEYYQRIFNHSFEILKCFGDKYKWSVIRNTAGYSLRYLLATNDMYYVKKEWHISAPLYLVALLRFIIISIISKLNKLFKR